MKKSALFILAALTVFAACSKEEVSDKTNKATSLVFTATFADSPADEELKATFASLKASWAAGDKILIRDSNGNEAVYAADAAGTTSSFSFESGDALSTSGVTYEAFFPSTAASELPLVQVLGTNGSDVTRFEAPMRASGTTTSLAFKNLCGLLKLNVTKASAAAGFNLKYILLEANKGLSGAYTVSSDAAVVSGSTPSVLNMASATSLGTTAKTFYMSVPAGSYSKFDITIMHNNTASFYEQTWSLKSGQSLSITRNTVTSLDLEINNPAINLSRDWANSGNIYTYGTANCYNAKVTNTRYKIRTVKGNSIESVGSVNSADLLWAATTSSTAPTSAQIGNLVKNVHYSNGYVYFERGGSQSNFAVAAKDASGNILWSWLIWGANAGFSDVEMVGGATMMDRNIGAFGTNVGGTSVIGLLYQYGRKDPFPGRVANSNTVAGVYGATFTVEDGGVSAATAVANPTVFYKAASNNNWSTDLSAATWDGDNKTIYDPCPVGYRVPDSSVWKEGGSVNTDHYVWNSSSYGFLYNDSVWFPATGQLGSTSGTLNSGTAITFMWCRDKNVSSGNPLMLDVRSTANAKIGGYASAGGIAVRCQKITN